MSTFENCGLGFTSSDQVVQVPSDDPHPRLYVHLHCLEPEEKEEFYGYR